MGILFLVRHAQASSRGQNYDMLSKLGETQARLLGEYWARHNIIFDRSCSGPGLRQRDTLKIVSEAYREAGGKFPDPLVLPEFDEYPGQAVLERSLPGLLKKDQAVCDLHAAFQSSSDSSRRQASFQKLFEVLIGRWVDGEICPPGVETWLEFCARVNSGLAKLLSDKFQ
jgi:broad specificity phosphatase PhoE